MITIVQVLIGFLILTMGRHLFWIVAAGLGFVITTNYSLQFATDLSQNLLLFISTAIAIIAAFAATFAPRIGGYLIGFGSGWYLVLTAQNYIPLGDELKGIVWQILAGFLGMLLAIKYFKWSVIILSSMVGATIIVDSFHYPNRTTLILLVFLTSLGILIQGVLNARTPD